MQNITIKVGQSLSFNVPVSGEPPPECVWTFKDKLIDNADPKIRVIFFFFTFFNLFRLQMRIIKLILR